MRRYLYYFIMIACFFSAAVVYGNIDLNNLYSRAVKEGVNCSVRIDSLLLETEVSKGVAQTSITLVLTPELPGSGTWGFKATEVYDSIEIYANFKGLQDFAAQELYLWVEGQPQRGYIQDRRTAEAQYQSIVGQRLDPAILSTRGNGSYSLKIFPASTGESRKVKIQLQHSFTDSASQIFTRIPFLFNKELRSTPAAIGIVKGSFTSLDSRSYSFSMEGLGRGTFSKGKQLSLTSENVEKLGSAVISASSPSGKFHYAWSGRDLIDKKLAMGFRYTLNETTVDLEPQPDTKVIVLDSRYKSWSWKSYYENKQKYLGNGSFQYPRDENIDILGRMKKLAVLAIKTYVADDQKFNLVLDESGTLFPSAVYPTESNLAVAYEAIKRFDSFENASVVKRVQTAVKSAPGEIVILLSDLYEPYDYYNKDYTVTESGRHFERILDSLGSVLTGLGNNLFTIADSYWFSTIAHRCGGHSLTELRNGYYAYRGDIGTERAIIPPLYTLGNSRGVSGVTLEADPRLGDVVYSLSNTSLNFWSGPVVIRWDGGWDNGGIGYGDNATELRVAAKLPQGSFSTNYVFTVRGKISGRRFVKKIYARPDYGSLFADTGRNVLWALQRCKSSNGLLSRDHDSIVKKTGMDYHIVTHQTSLLALEPGMVLWPDTLSAPAFDLKISSSFQVTNQIVIQDGTRFSAGGSVDLDGIAIEDIINGAVLPIYTNNKSRHSAPEVKIRNVASGVELTLSSKLKGHAMELKLFDLAGRMVASRTLSGTETSGSRVLWNVYSGTKLTSNRYYVLKVRSNSFETSHRVLMIKK